ncbi:MAG: hypothetical protein PHC84_06815, partial [Clostridia bacterium]|nr:hypothetical protein [Clostridia bacterium]
PMPTTLNFVELLGEEYNGSFTKDITIGSGTSLNTYYGISLAELFTQGVLNAAETDKMYLRAWDYITNGTEFFYREYTNWKNNEYYANSFLVYSYKEGAGEVQPYDRCPMFDGANILKGMSVKNVLSLSVKDTALVCLDMAYDRFDVEHDGEINLSDILGLVNMMKGSQTYTVKAVSGTLTDIPGTVLAESTLEKNGEEYILHYGDQSMTIASISIKK